METSSMKSLILEKMTGTQSFEVDITGCQVVAIEASGDYDSCVYVTDDQLK